ncbi:MAG: hypothetical protein LBG59_03125 [Candidatus Peribacteria bacterium]|nr:hypothetical protein [Candidatus Peribacteria bacterium]
MTQRKEAKKVQEISDSLGWVVLFRLGIRMLRSRSPTGLIGSANGWLAMEGLATEG